MRKDKDQRTRLPAEGESAHLDARDFIHLAFENANVGMCLVDLKGCLLTVNRRMCDIFGYSKAEFEGMAVNEITHPDFLDVSPGFIERALEGGVSDGEFLKQYIHKTGRIIWGQVSSSLVRDDDGTPLYFISYVKDMTEVKRAEHELRKERDFISAVLSTAGALVVVLDRQGRIVRFNRACEKMTGYRFDDVEGKPFWDLFLLKEEVDRVKTVFNRLRSGHFPNEHENYWVTRSGSQRLIRWSNTALTEPDGSVIYVIGTGIDITDTRSAEAKLRDSEERFALATKGSGYGLWDWSDTQRDAVWWSLRLYEMLGYEDGEIESSFNSFNRLLHPEDRSRAHEAIKAHLRNDDNYDIELRLQTKSGDYRWFRSCGAAIRDADGRPTRMSGSLVDISDRKQAEKALLTSERQYRTLLANLDTAVVVHAPDTRIVLSNHRAQELLGISETEMADRMDRDSEWYFLRGDGTRMPVEEYPVDIVMATLKPLQYYLVGIHQSKHRQVVWVEVNAFPEFDELDVLRQIVVTFWDVTKRKADEDHLARQAIDLASINRELRRQIAERKQAEEKLQQQRRQADRDLEVAATIQRTLIPQYSPRIGPIRFAWRFQPCQQIGGDIFHFQYTGKNAISFYMFDVCGHGVSSALIASAVSQFLQTSCEPTVSTIEIPQPEAVLSNLERAFPFERFDSYFTIVYLTVHYVSGTLYYSSAGHPPPVLLGTDGSLRLLDRHGPVIGVGSGHSFRGEEVPLKSGDKVIVYTDGILDYSNPEGEFFGKDRLFETLRQHADCPVQTLMDRVEGSLKTFADSTRPGDDASIMAIEYVG